MQARLSAVPGWILLLAGIFAAGFAILTVPPEPRGPGEATDRLQAESLVRDGDRVYDEVDRARFAGKEWPSLQGGGAATVEVSSSGGSLRFHRPWPYPLALAPFVLVAPQRGPLVLNLLILSGLALALAVRYHRNGPESAPYWSGALLFASLSFPYARAAWPELFVGSLLVLAYLLSGDSTPRSEQPEMAGERLSLGVAFSRWLGVGALVALAVLQEPLLAVFFLAFLFLAFRTKNEGAWSGAIGGFAAVLLLTWLLGETFFPGVAPWGADNSISVRPLDELADVERWVARLQSVEAPGFVWQSQLAMWNGLYAVVGRHMGIGLCFLPLAVLAVTSRSRQWSLWLAAGCFVAASIAVDPFNIAGGPEGLGFGRLVPVAVLLGFSVRPRNSALAAVVAGALGVVALWPLWLGLSEHPSSLRGQPVFGPLNDLLPYETSQRHVPANAEVFSRLLLVRTANDGLRAGAGAGHLLLRGGREAELMVASARRLAHLDLEFGPRAGSELDVLGAEIENLLFRPGGGVTFRLTPAETRIRHRIWGRDDTHYLHMLKFSMPGESRDLPFLVTGEAARPGSAGEPGDRQ